MPLPPPLTPAAPYPRAPLRPAAPAQTTPLVAKLLRNVHPDVVSRFYGCGSPIPPLLAGATVLDLGCGTGRDVYVAAQLVGAAGLAIGVDMTREQLDVAEATEAWHAAKFGLAAPNTLFVQGDIENLKKAGVKDASVDVVVSNCVLNLASNKLAVFKEIHRVLKPGGELYFSDVYADRRVPAALQGDKVLWGECLSGALYRGDFDRCMRAAGFATHYVVTSRRISVDDPAIKARVGAIGFFSETVRAFEVAGLEDGGREDYGQAATYDGSFPSHPHAFHLGGGAVFITGSKTPVDGNTAKVLAGSRYAAAFKVTPAKDHRGAWRGGGGGGDGGGAMFTVAAADDDGDGAAACCPPAGAGGGGAGGGTASRCC